MAEHKNIFKESECDTFALPTDIFDWFFPLGQHRDSSNSRRQALDQFFVYTSLVFWSELTTLDRIDLYLIFQMCDLPTKRINNALHHLIAKGILSRVSDSSFQLNHAKDKKAQAA